MIRRVWLVFLLMFGLSAGVRASAAESVSAPAGIEFFEAKVRPLLADRCYKCHSDSAEKLKGGLHLDSPAGILAGGESGAILDSAHPENGRLFSAIGYENPDLQMPPKAKLTDPEIATIKQWLRMGAPLPKDGSSPVAGAKAFDLEKRRATHWAWQPVRSIDPPANTNPSWSKNPIDRFVFAKLAAKGLTPAAPAERRTLVRRAYFDLIGLPPTPQEVQAFLDDAAPDAFEKVVDRLLASDHFGERWARHWLDLARYAETYGHEFDFPIANADQYLLYVVRALNADVPYDQFATEQIAGDLLPHPRLNPKDGFNESIIGTGFWFLGEQTHAPVDARQHQADRIDNQIEVFSKTFLGLTVNCARCHDHKFDAISAKDYYALFGILESTNLQQAYLDPHGNIAAAARTIDACRSEASRLLLSKLPDPKKAGDSFAAYLLASREVAAGPVASEIVFEDFEKPTYEGWEVEGSAFGAGPQTRKTIAAYQGDVGAAGNGFVNSHNIHAGEDIAGGDRHVGKLTSRPFTIERRFIRFLIGGGANESRTCLNVVIDGKPVRTAKGRNDNRMLPAEFDVAEFRGKTARIEIVDAEAGPWGNIGVDQIVFADSAATGGAPASPAEIQRVAAARNLDAKVLGRVIDSLRGEAVKQPAHPLYVWSKVAGATSAADAFAALRVEAKAINDDRANSKSFTSVVSGSAKWSATGEAFGGEELHGRLIDLSDKLPKFVAPVFADSRSIDRRLRGVLRSPSFVLEDKRIFYRVAGQGGQVRLVVDGYIMDSFSSLLFEGLMFPVNTRDGGFEWHEQNVERYLGHRAHIELIDDGDGWLALDEIRLADAGPMRDAAPVLDRAFGAGGTKDVLRDLQSVAQDYGDQLSEALAALTPGKADAAQINLANWCIETGMLFDASGYRELQSSLAANAAKIDAMPLPQPSRALTAADGNGVDEHVFLRGSPKTRGEVSPRRFLEAIAGPHQPPLPDDQSGRLQLAQGVCDPANPLTARVMANRVWHHLLGRGIVATTDDFGVMGQAPTHPELLDYLADQFRNADGWSVKKLIRSIMLSQTYQLSSTPDEKAAQVDANNDLLQHARVRRLEGEIIRDSILAVSGRLDRNLDGPFVEVALTPFMEGRGRPASGPLDGLGRRSLYLHVRRNFLSPMLQAFDAPTPFSTMGRRSVSNVPAQALILLNDPFVIEQCQRWAKETLEEKGLSSAARIDRMYETAFGRPPTEPELSAAKEFLIDQCKELGLPPQASETDPRVWTDLGHVLLNAKEFIFLD